MFFHVSTFWCGGFQFIGKIAISKCLPFRLEPDFSLMIYIKKFFPLRIPSIMSLSGIKCTLKKGAGQLFQRWRKASLDRPPPSPPLTLSPPSFQRARVSTWGTWPAHSLLPKCCMPAWTTNQTAPTPCVFT
uniref:Uncharacterized protein n=1 Tax=Bos indicus x Bos taurus TaxID=30522 RepID=A0A4W2HNV0_BOBOX